MMHGCIFSDETGFGKTKTLLLTAFLHIVLYDLCKEGNIVTRPMLLVVPANLVNQWLQELTDHWFCFQTLVSFSDHDFKEVMALSSINHLAMSEYPRIDQLPGHLRYIWDHTDESARSALVVTSYETHKSRTTTKKTEIIAGVHFKPPRYDAEGNPVWKKKPRVIHYYVTNQPTTFDCLRR
jgi:hypothetical protein